MSEGFYLFLIIVVYFCKYMLMYFRGYFEVLYGIIVYVKGHIRVF